MYSEISRKRVPPNNKLVHQAYTRFFLKELWAFNFVQEFIDANN